MLFFFSFYFCFTSIIWSRHNIKRCNSFKSNNRYSRGILGSKRKRNFKSVWSNIKSHYVSAPNNFCYMFYFFYFSKTKKFKNFLFVLVSFGLLISTQARGAIFSLVPILLLTYLIFIKFEIKKFFFIFIFYFN